MAATAAKVVWIVRLLGHLGISNLKPVTLNCDNMSATYIPKNPVYHDRTKHIEIDCYFTREKVLESLLQLSFLLTTHQLADVLTKVLPSAKFNELIGKLGMSTPVPVCSKASLLKTSAHDQPIEASSVLLGVC